MSPISHYLIGWVVAALPRGLGRRERAIIAVAGVAPDLDGLGLVVELATEHTAHPLPWYGEYHHVLLHNLGGVILTLLLALALARHRRGVVAALAGVSFHLHLLGDLMGSRGPEGYQWPIPYLLPFSDAWQLTWSGQWELDAWQNLAITAVVIALCLGLCRWRGASPLEPLWPRGDRALVGAVAGWGARSGAAGRQPL